MAKSNQTAQPSNSGSGTALGALALGVGVVGAVVLMKKKAGAAGLQLGDAVTLSKISFSYKGEAGTLYVAWGLANGAFADGAGLIGGLFGIAGPIPVTASAVYKDYVIDPNTLAIKPVIILAEPTFAVGTFDTYAWLTTKASTLQADMARDETGKPVLVNDIGAIKIS
ncbi:MAG: hypothetical protein WC551_14140 [Patescibacteria group bacterium]